MTQIPLQSAPPRVGLDRPKDNPRIFTPKKGNPAIAPHIRLGSFPPYAGRPLGGKSSVPRPAVSSRSSYM